MLSARPIEVPRPVPLALIRRSPRRCTHCGDEERELHDEEREQMMTITRSSIGAVAAVLISCLLAGSAVAAGPQATITVVTPTTAVAGQMVTISGTGLDGTQGVTFGNVQATPFVVD